MHTYTLPELIHAIRLRQGLIPPSLPGVIIIHHDRPASDELLEARIRARYAELLFTAPLDKVPVADLADQVTDISRPTPNSLLLTLPDAACRLVEVRLQGWPDGVRTFHASNSPFHRRQADRYLRSTPDSPGAVLLPDRRLLLFGLEPLEASQVSTLAYPAIAPENLRARLHSLRATAQTDPDLFPLHPSLLDSLLDLSPAPGACAGL